jgi:hypothetical protein
MRVPFCQGRARGLVALAVAVSVAVLGACSPPTARSRPPVRAGTDEPAAIDAGHIADAPRGAPDGRVTDEGSAPDANPENDDDGAARLDASAPPDDAAETDLPTTPDVSPDAESAPDAAEDQAAPGDATPPPDLVPADVEAGAPALVIDDFQTSTTATNNNLASAISGDNETCNRANGEMVCVWNGTGSFHDFIETLNNWCSFDARAYTKLGFRMRTSVAGETVAVYLGVNGGGACTQTPSLLGVITTSTTMTSYTFDIAEGVRASSLTVVELDPRSTNATQFIFDDFQLLP